MLVGLPEGEAAMWAFAGLSDMLPEGGYRIADPPEGGDPTRLALGWALGTYAFTRYRDKKKPSGARLVWPKGADRAQVERLAGAVFLARDLINTPASDMGPAELAAAAVEVAEKAGARHRVISATRCSPRTTRRSMPSAAPACARRGWSISSGARNRRPR